MAIHNEIEFENDICAHLAARASSGNTGDAGITYVAFTATPKSKTLELFGRRPNPALPAGPDNLPAPFHVYSMRQAIEEGFILDVLKNYTPYSLAFKLASEGREWDETEVERGAAMKGIMRWVRLHPYNISQKVQVVVEHFRENVAPLLEGRAKAMVVVGSRLEAVRWQLAIDQYIKSQNYKIGTLVAFSGEVNDKESGPDPFTENSKALNPNLRGRDMREAFATDEVLAAFKTYYATAELAGVTDPHLVYDLRAKLDAAGYYDEHEVERVVAVEMNPNSAQYELNAALEPVADRLLKRYQAARKAWQDAQALNDAKAMQAAQDEMNALQLFKRDLGSFQRVYAFLSQIFDYGNTAIEKRAIFFRRLLPLLEFGREREGVDLSKVVLTHHKLKNQGKRALPLGVGEPLQPLTEPGSGEVQEKDKVRLAEIIEKVNTLFEGELSDDDKLVYVNHVLKGKLLESDILVRQASNNTKEQFSNSPDFANELMNAIMDALSAHSTMSKQALDSEHVRDGLKDVLLGPARLYEALREQGGSGKGPSQ